MQVGSRMAVNRFTTTCCYRWKRFGMEKTWMGWRLTYASFYFRHEIRRWWLPSMIIGQYVDIDGRHEWSIQAWRFMDSVGRPKRSSIQLGYCNILVVWRYSRIALSFLRRHCVNPHQVMQHELGEITTLSRLTGEGVCVIFTWWNQYLC